MPNKERRDKKLGSLNRDRTGSGPRKTHSVKELLGRRAPALVRVSDQATRQAAWRQWLEERLAADLLPRLSGVVERQDTLVIFTESAAWSARLRYAIAELEAEIRAAHPAIARVTVRVLPRS